MRVLKWGVKWPAIGSWQQLIERITEADTLKTTGEVAQELEVYHCMVVTWCLKQTGKVKRLNKWVPHELTTNQKKKKKTSFFCIIFSYCRQRQWTISQSDCDIWWRVDFTWQLATASSVTGPRRSKALPKTKLPPKKGHGLCLLVCSHLIHYSLLNPKETITSVMFSKSIRCTENCNTCSQHCQLKASLILFHDNVWSYIAQPMLYKLNELHYKTLPHPYSPYLSPTTNSSSSILTFFLQGKCSHNQ